MAVAAGEEKGFRPGMVAVVQTFGDQLNIHPHVHALVTRGGWTGSGEWVPVPYVSSVTVPAGDGRALGALARYCLRNPVSLARLRWTPGSETATYLPRDGHAGQKVETLDALDFVARLLAHVPNPRRHLVHYYGAYSNVVRGKPKVQSRRAEPPASGPGAPPPLPPASVSPSSPAASSTTLPPRRATQGRHPRLAARPARAFS